MSSPGQENDLTDDDEERRLKRREKNKSAAAKCRAKRRTHIDKLQTQSDEQSDRKSALFCEVEALEKERAFLIELLNSHQPGCIMGMAIPLTIDQIQSINTQHSESNISESATSSSTSGATVTVTTTA